MKGWFNNKIIPAREWPLTQHRSFVGNIRRGRSMHKRFFTQNFFPWDRVSLKWALTTFAINRLFRTKDIVPKGLRWNVAYEFVWAGCSASYVSGKLRLSDIFWHVCTSTFPRIWDWIFHNILDSCPYAARNSRLIVYHQRGSEHHV